jgi:hypothetical protein
VPPLGFLAPLTVSAIPLRITGRNGSVSGIIMGSPATLHYSAPSRKLSRHGAAVAVRCLIMLWTSAHTMAKTMAHTMIVLVSQPD